MRRPAVLLVLLLCLSFAAPATATGPGPEDPLCQRAGVRLRVIEWLEGFLPDHGPWRFLRRLVERQQALVRHFLTEQCVRLNHVQALGTHNSYHLQPRPRLFQALVLFEPEALGWEYSHLPLARQFAEQGVRQIELDVFADPQGGLYARRPVLILVGDPVDSGIPELDEPGIKVLHVQDVDFETTCVTLELCLQEVKAWSDANPMHLPLMILVEAKDAPIPDDLNIGFAIPVPFDAAQFDALDAEIRAVFPEEQLILPDDVRGEFPRLEDAVLERGWPTLGESRGRVLFALDNGGGKRAIYRDGAPSLEGRVLFTNAVPGDADAAFVKANDPLGDPALIPDLVGTGYVVRTRADADLQEGRSGDTLRRDAALVGGAHWVSTDFPAPRPELGSDYAVQIPGGAPARCNPVSAPAWCRDDALESLPLP